MNEYGGSLQQHQQHTTTTTTRSSKRLKTNNNNNNTPQGKTNSNEVEVLQKPLSFRRVENVVYSHKRLLRCTTRRHPKLIRRNKINDKTMGRKQILKRLAIQTRRKKLLGRNERRFRRRFGRWLRERFWRLWSNYRKVADQ